MTHVRPLPCLLVGARFALALALAVTATMASPSLARPPTSPRTAAVAVRALGYDRTLRERAGKRADLVVLTSAALLRETEATFGALASVGVQGLPLLVTVAAPSSADELRAAVIDRHAEAVFVEHLDEALLPTLRALSRETGCLVFVVDRALLGRGGHVAIVDDGVRARLVVALTAARADRLELAADLLKLAEIVR
jgi:hypothetical protein